MDAAKQVKEATDIVAIIGQSVKLVKSGAAFKGCCPFHNEKSPSFYVNPKGQYFHCFGCGASGDVFKWLQDREGLSFSEVLQMLAAQAGITLEFKNRKPDLEVKHEDSLLKVLDDAAIFYERHLDHAPLVLAYLNQRGFSAEAIREFRLGAAPDGWDRLLKHLLSMGYKDDLLMQAGLISRTEKGSFIDFLRNRVVIPIRDHRGRVIAFGGRVMGDEQPKYLNTRETSLFKKSEVLFGLNRAKTKSKEGFLIVEGYFDVLQLHRLGINQAVAPMGTALTGAHLKIIHKWSQRIVLCFDGDEAGRKAMESSLRLALPLEFDVRLLELPTGEDPDSWALKLGSDAFASLISVAPGWTEFMIGRLTQSRDLSRLQDRIAIFRELVPLLRFLPRTSETREIWAGLSHQLGIPESEMKRSINVKVENTLPALPPDTLKIHESIKQLVHYYSTFGISELKKVPEGWWTNLEGSSIIHALIDVDGEESDIPADYLSYIRAVATESALRNDAPITLDMGQSTLQRLEMNFLESERLRLQQSASEPSNVINRVLLEQIEKELVQTLARKSNLAAQMRAKK